MKTDPENTKGNWRDALRASWSSDAPSAEELGAIWAGVEARAAELVARDRAGAARRATPSPWAIAWHARAVTVAVLLLTVTASGSVAAAEGSLPGDLLYPIKIQLNDAAIEIAAIGSEANARAKVAIVNRRVAEIKELAAAGRLDDEALTEISENIEGHAAEIQRELAGEDDEDEGRRAAAKIVAEDLSRAVDESAAAIAVASASDEDASPVDSDAEGADEENHGELPPEEAAVAADGVDVANPEEVHTKAADERPEGRQKPRTFAKLEERRRSLLELADSLETADDEDVAEQKEREDADGAGTPGEEAARQTEAGQGNRALETAGDDRAPEEGGTPAETQNAER